MEKVAVLMGGYSGELDISLKSGDFVFKHLDRSVFDPVRVILSKERWYVEEDDKTFDLLKEDFSYFDGKKQQKISLCYNTIHGTPGEDGFIQAYLDLMGIKYTGCESHTSAITFNKAHCNILLKSFGIPISKSIVVKTDEKEGITYQGLSEKLGTTFMVKASRSGSSLGVSKVEKSEDLASALDAAFEVDDSVLIESFVTGTEVSIGVYRDENKQINVLEPTEIVTSEDFFNFEAKYFGQSEEITPARIPTSVREKVQNLTFEVYQLMEIEGIARVDFIIENDVPYFIEINTNPGLSPESIFPKQAYYAKLDLVHLFTSQLKIARDKPNLWKKG